MTLSEVFPYIGHNIRALFSAIGSIELKYIYWPIGIILGSLLFWALVAHAESLWEKVEDKVSTKGFIWVAIILLYMIFVVTPDLFEAIKK